jgi:hypothetical protein
MIYGTFDINVGDTILVKDEYIDPSRYPLICVECGDDHPFFFDGNQRSAISTEIITGVIKP